jgi:hypothetical protein
MQGFFIFNFVLRRDSLPSISFFGEHVKTQEEKDVFVIGILRLYLVIAKLKYYATPVLALPCNHAISTHIYNKNIKI